MEEVLGSVATEMPLQSLSDAERYLEGLINLERDAQPTGRRVSLDAISNLLSRIGSPERAFRVLHIAGSKGKGSTALIAESLLRGAGLRIGTFTSPHLSSWTERFRISGRRVSSKSLVDVVATLRPNVEALRKASSERAPTFFDVTTAVAFELFKRAEVDIGIIEVGLGGRLDSTNVVSPEVTCVTSIELEHTDKLGSTLEKIAGEKAGIIKRRVPVVIGPLPTEAEKVVTDKAIESSAPPIYFGRDFGVEVESVSTEGISVRFWDGDISCGAALPILGRPQAENAALAWMCARTLEPDIDWKTIAPRALGNVILPGRMEIVNRRPWMIVDSAHTTASARALMDTLKYFDFSELRLVLSVSSGKDVYALCREIVPEAKEVIVTRAQLQRSLSEELVASVVRDCSQNCSIQSIADPRLAVEIAKESLPESSLLCAFGSTYLAGIARQSWLEGEGVDDHTP